MLAASNVVKQRLDFGHALADFPYRIIGHQRTTRSPAPSNGSTASAALSRSKITATYSAIPAKWSIKATNFPGANV
jgi:hypothetical protein